MLRGGSLIAGICRYIYYQKFLYKHKDKSEKHGSFRIRYQGGYMDMLSKAINGVKYWKI